MACSDPGASCDRYENCKHDGYHKDLARPVIRRHDNLLKVHDYDLGSESLANARRRDTMVAPNDGINHGSRAPDGTRLTQKIAEPPMPPEIYERIVYESAHRLTSSFNQMPQVPGRTLRLSANPTLFPFPIALRY